MGIESFRRTQNLLTMFTQAICAFLLTLLVVNISMAVFTRYVFFLPLNFSNQLSKYLLMWLAFMGSSLAIEKGQHVAVEIFLGKLPPDIRNMLLVTFDIFVTMFFFVVIYYGFMFSLNAKAMGFRDPLIWHMNLMYAYLSVPIGFIFMAIQFNLTTIIKIMDTEKTTVFFEN
jgi:TRAP-type C4-dicarboxylate transport system permease small subunit